MNMKQKYYDSSAPFSGHIRCYVCNKFGRVANECKKKSINFHKKHDKQSDKNIVTTLPEKDGSTNTSHNK